MDSVGMQGSGWRLDCWACMYLVTALSYQLLDSLVGYDVRTQRGHGLNKNEILYISSQMIWLTHIDSF